MLTFCASPLLIRICLLVRFTGTLYWYALLVCFTGTLYWYALLLVVALACPCKHNPCRQEGVAGVVLVKPSCGNKKKKARGTAKAFKGYAVCLLREIKILVTRRVSQEAVKIRRRVSLPVQAVKIEGFSNYLYQRDKRFAVLLCFPNCPGKPRLQEGFSSLRLLRRLLLSPSRDTCLKALPVQYLGAFLLVTPSSGDNSLSAELCYAFFSA